MPITLPFFGPFRPAHLFVSIVLAGLAPAIWVGANLDTWITPAPSIARLGDAPTGRNADPGHADLPPATEPMTWHPPYAPDYVLPSIGTSPGHTQPSPAPGHSSPAKGTQAPPPPPPSTVVPEPSGTHTWPTTPPTSTPTQDPTSAPPTPAPPTLVPTDQGTPPPATGPAAMSASTEVFPAPSGS